MAHTLSRDTLYEISRWLPAEDVARARRVCKRWCEALTSERIWKERIRHVFSYDICNVTPGGGNYANYVAFFAYYTQRDIENAIYTIDMPLTCGINFAACGIRAEKGGPEICDNDKYECTLRFTDTPTLGVRVVCTKNGISVHISGTMLTFTPREWITSVDEFIRDGRPSYRPQPISKLRRFFLWRK